MTRDTLLYITRFITLVLVQVLVLNHVNFFGFLNPYIYVIFILLTPVNINKSFFLILSFLLGLSIDLFSDSGGIHAAACTIIAFFRPVILRSVFGLSYEFHHIKLNVLGFKERLVYVTLMVILHHIVLFSLEFFNLSHTLLMLKKALFSSAFTIFTIMIVLALFSKNNS